MPAWLISFITGLLGKWLGGLFPSLAPKGAPDTATLAAQAASAASQLAQQEAENAVMETAATARSDADRRVLDEFAKPGGLDTDPEGHWRD